MLGPDIQERHPRSGPGATAILDRVPPPLRVLLDRIERGLIDLANAGVVTAGHPEGTAGREAVHAVRSALSDICALTEAEANPEVRRAVERLVDAVERLADGAARPHRSRAALRGAATRALRNLALALVGTRPSRIALSLGRGW
jgi:hypothetical protein